MDLICIGVMSMESFCSMVKAAGDDVIFLT